jgi:sulfate transport system ATP-binding protein
MSIELTHISKTYGNFQALRDVELAINDGELVALLGPSGSGKTTLLRIIAGLDTPDVVQGGGNGSRIRFAETDVSQSPAADRRVGFVFQHYALFRHMSVFENIAFGMRVRPRKNRPANDVIEKRVNELLGLVQLEGLGKRFPSQLSGGQRRAWLRKLHEEIHVTSILVTHDQEEALEVADRVVVMNHGKIEQIGTPEEVFHKPATQFVMEFLGQVNVFHGRVRNGKTMLEGMVLDYPQEARSEGRQAKVYMRPHELDIKLLPNGAPHMAASIERVNPAGSIAKVTAKTLDGSQVFVDLSLDSYQRLRLRNGDRVYIYPKNARVFVPEPEYEI